MKQTKRRIEYLPLCAHTVHYHVHCTVYTENCQIQFLCVYFERFVWLRPCNLQRALRSHFSSDSFVSCIFHVYMRCIHVRIHVFRTHFNFPLPVRRVQRATLCNVYTRTLAADALTIGNTPNWQCRNDNLLMIGQRTPSQMGIFQFKFSFHIFGEQFFSVAASRI